MHSLKHRKKLLFKLLKLTVRQMLALIIYNIMLIIAFLTLHSKHSPLVWLFDDKYVMNTGLTYYVDFRPGYPPLGKLPYTLLYRLFNNAESIMLFHLIVLNIILILLYKLLKGITTSRRAFIITCIVAAHYPMIWVTMFNPHADLLALIWLILSLYFIISSNPVGAGFSCGLGLLTKIYGALLLVPAFMLFKGWERVVLVSTFLTVVFLASLPFIALDPIMYLSVYVQHFFRGPSESIFALLDGYFLHTGFLHPTYEATIYFHQFLYIYTPSNIDHFRYSWSYPQLRYISSGLQMFFFLLFSIMSSRTHHSTQTALKMVSLAMISYFTFSAFWNPIVSIPFFIFLALATLDIKLSYQVLILVGFTIVDTLHIRIWFPGLPLGIHLGLLTVVVARAILISILLSVVKA
uniref:Glycosyltransferase RgtA/B/C/D-like domain-containing protein n=1 Tax=Ignisphaera aggregans TaxID=334771 RepID=A0A7J3YTR5_9CREN